MRGSCRRCSRKAIAGRDFRYRQHQTGEETLRQTSYAQPALFAVEMGLARLWQSWGFEPDVVLGHSVGQYSAACVAGVFSLEDGMLLMAERGRLFGSLPAGGRMVAVFTARRTGRGVDRRVPKPVGCRLQRCQHRIVGSRKGSGTSGGSACRPTASGATGWRPATRSTRRCWSRSSTNSSRTQTNSHTLRHNGFWCDNRTGAALGRSVKLDGNYWRRHARQPVEFAKSVQTLVRSELQGATRNRPATGADRRGSAGMARPGHHAAGDRVVA